ncbi:23S rRNA pseudouridine(2604) synthase RluF [Rheinheimera aquimaris]|jgi:pseudouridine synthase|uniref:23S rRNA pseudouridine(2604) synthase RluF n=1 Tax=Rheinheimera aquimaris TaxID=412437 RepID=UPI000E84A732|nr:23S rRNA pseudouridine(2604) synthase RluF [Rheinheimera aquimaris]HBN90792.1 23S rRNA pseudouridine(2604) synthase RluF [Rheinheimera sp.]|tara:strand:+ start:3910 stop:4668 length:759 start_codon:yes stop_codon:yes gene_type:complete
MSDNTLYRLNKFISDTGFCSRREADRLIENGNVTINGVIAAVGTKVSEQDQVLIDGKPLKDKPKRVYLAYHKPVGITCTTERHIQGNIVDAVRYPERIFPIGRLDKPSEGLIFLTNDGDIVNKILRAGNAHEKEYIVTVNKPITERFIQQMSRGVPILDTVTLPCTVQQRSKQSFSIILTQGLNRQIRRMCEYLGYDVVTLKRNRIMHIRLAGLKPGQWRLLEDIEIKMLEQQLLNSSKTVDSAGTVNSFED